MSQLDNLDAESSNETTESAAPEAPVTASSPEEVVAVDQTSESAQDSTEEKDTAPSASPKAERKGEQRPNDPEYDQFLEIIGAFDDIGTKLQKTVDFMEQTLAQEGSPHFRNFWAARKLAMDFFKQSINPVLRSTLWDKYIELSNEARRLKSLLDEQSAFAVEQIESAISALEAEVASIESGTVAEHSFEFPMKSVTLEPRAQFYTDHQKQLGSLNASATRINSLRKELIKTDMRIRHKNKFFQRLSAAGDKIFPKRKELVKAVSDAFLEDVARFVSECEGAVGKGPLHEQRDEIKALQAVAKVLTLNTKAFTQTRGKLSKCWDIIKEVEKERRQERQSRQVAFQENAQGIANDIDAFSAEFAEGNMSLKDANKRLDDIVALMRKTELGRDDVRGLKNKLSSARKPVQVLEDEEEAKRRAQDEAREKDRQRKRDELKEKFSALIASVDSKADEEVAGEREELIATLKGLQLSRAERMECDRLVKALRDAVADKAEKALLDLSGEDQAALDQLRALLKQRKERCAEIKSNLEDLRRQGGTSGLDFEQGLAQSEMLEEEKTRLLKAQEGVEEVRAKIKELKAG